MKKLLAVITILCVCFLLAVSLAEAQLSDAPYVLYAVSAGKADALLLKAGDHTFLIDTGYTRSRGKILYAMEQLGVEQLDAVLITHTDSDHTNGLTWLAESDIRIGSWCASAFYLDVKEKKHPATKAAAIRSEQVVWLQAGDSFPLGEATLEVLAPGVLFDDKDNNNSLVLMLRTPYGNILLCGDMEYPQEKWLLQSGAELDCDVLMVPNHADDDVCSEAFLKATTPTVALISTDTQEKEDTPYPPLMVLLSRYCKQTLQTQRTTGGVCATLSEDGVQTYSVALPDPQTGMVIESVSSQTDTLVLRNTSNTAMDISGWYMITDIKNTYYVFPESTMLQPGESYTVGSRSTETQVDAVWNEKKLINKKKTDGVTLYDRYGNKIAYADNGL